MGQVAVRAWIAMNQPIDTHQDACAPGEIPQPVEPVAVLVSLLDTHGSNVAHGLHWGNRGRGANA